ncbi:MAG: BMP family ABC transporter substrate-binding protein [Selenomonadaceae bacterium]|nr:BMP family ABC transporter substrate-binding protein [Selenomonadaceae bacterium]
MNKFINFRYAIIIAGVFFLLAFILSAVNFGKTLEDQPEKIGFIILGDITKPGWNESHYRGIKAACENFGIELMVRDNVKENSGQCPVAIRELAENGAKMIFLASYSYSLEARDIVEEYPKIAFATNSAEIHSRNMTAYFVRMYQARYLSGALAGMKTKSNVIGYVAAMPNSEVIRGIDAFALGVQRVNPDAKVVVMWTGKWQDEETEAAHAERLIKEAGADVLTYHQDEDSTARTADKFGVDFIAYNEVLKGYSEHYLASVVCNWESYYVDIIQRYLKGEINSVKNHWLGIDRGAVGLSNYSSAVTPDMITKLDYLKQELTNHYQIFSGPLYNIDGEIFCEEGDAISDDKLLEDMNQLVRGVEILE